MYSLRRKMGPAGSVEWWYRGKLVCRYSNGILTALGPSGWYKVSRVVSATVADSWLRANTVWE